MKNIFKIFISDVKRIFQNVVAVVVIMGPVSYTHLTLPTIA